MKITVTKSPDGNFYMTKDGHGELFDGDVGAEPVVFGDCSLQIAPDSHVLAEPDEQVVLFSWVDYLDTSNREVPGAGVRHTEERRVPGRWDFGPYVVEVVEKKGKK